MALTKQKYMIRCLLVPTAVLIKISLEAKKMNTRVGKIAELVSSNELLKGTFFETLVKTIAMENFKQLTDTEMQPGEVDLGKLNEYEKALVTMQINIQAEQAVLIEQHNEAGPFAPNVRDIQLAIKEKKDDFDTAQLLMWSSIKKRIADNKPEGSSGVAVRKDDTIVAMPPDTFGGPDESMLEALASVLGSGFGKMMAIGPNGTVFDFGEPCEDPNCPDCSPLRGMDSNED